MENPPIFASQPNIAQAPTSPPTPRNFVIPRRHPEQSQSVINLWFQLFFISWGMINLLIIYATPCT
jgi:hypothetical protein